VVDAQERCTGEAAREETQKSESPATYHLAIATVGDREAAGSEIQRTAATANPTAANAKAEVATSANV
jgi:hypothetical protein